MKRRWAAVACNQFATQPEGGHIRYAQTADLNSSAAFWLHTRIGQGSAGRRRCPLLQPRHRFPARRFCISAFRRFFSPTSPACRPNSAVTRSIFGWLTSGRARSRTKLLFVVCRGFGCVVSILLFLALFFRLIRRVCSVMCERNCAEEEANADRDCRDFFHFVYLLILHRKPGPNTLKRALTRTMDLQVLTGSQKMKSKWCGQPNQPVPDAQIAASFWRVNRRFSIRLLFLILRFTPFLQFAFWMVFFFSGSQELFRLQGTQ